MARKGNLAFLESVCPPTVKDRSYDALLTWLFGTEERTITVCVRIAYQSMKRKSRELIKMPEKDALALFGNVEGMISRCIDDLLKGELSQQESFDSWHRNTCEQTLDISNKHNPLLTFGLAQYWLNMTIKHMLLMEKWDEILEPIKKHLHIPVDGFIIEAASKNLGIMAIDKPWSRWDYSEYIKFQDGVRRAVGCPIDWEFSVWSKTNAEGAQQ